MGAWPTGAGVVDLPDGRRIRGRGLRRSRDDKQPDPEFGVYLLSRDPGVTTWHARWVRWRDFGLPSSTGDAVAALRETHARSATERVEIACGGGVGRTGTALTVLAVMSGIAVDDAVEWVRDNYHLGAVETRRQRRWISEVGARLL